VASYNKLIAFGHLGQDPELRYTPQGTAVCNFSMATSEKYRGKNGEKLERTTWLKVTVWGKQAENAAKYLAKGRKAYVEGRMHVEEWTDREGKSRHTVEVNASEVQYLDSAGDSNGEHEERRPARNTKKNDEALSLDDIDDDEIPF
jgi:single-strand DNA-binding protein